MLRQYPDVAPVLEGSGEAMYVQITRAIIKEIQLGRYQGGAALPGSRVLAKKLQVSRQTVIQALEYLVAKGWLFTVPQKGTFVSPEEKWPVAKERKTSISLPSFSFNQFTSGLMSLKVGTKPGQIRFDDGFADLKLSPLKELMTAYRSLYEQHLRIKKTETFHIDGPELLRKELNLMLQQHRGIALGEENVSFIRGNQLTFFLMVYCLVSKGDIVAVENPGNLFAWDIFRQAGASLLPIPVDAQGIDTDALADACKTRKIKAVYVTPQCQYPTTVILTQERRKHLVQLAEKYGFAIIESDYEHEFWFTQKPVLPMAADYPNTVIYTGSLSRMLNPLMRIGFVTGPASYINSLKALAVTVDSCGDFVLEKTVATLMNEGILNRYVRKSITIYRERRDLMANCITKYLSDNARFKQPDGGLAYWVEFPAIKSARWLTERLAELDISIPPLALYHFYHINEHTPAAFRVGFGAVSASEMDEAFRRLQKVLP